MGRWIIKIQTEIEDEEAHKLLVWALRKVGMGIISISKDEETWWPHEV